MRTKKTIDHEAFVSALRKRYRTTLLKMGLPATFHIYDTPPFPPCLDSLSPQDIYLLQYLRCAYFDLPRWDKEIFIAEILEKGRYYPFWFEEMSSRNQVFGRAKELAAELHDGLKKRGIAL